MKKQVQKLLLVLVFLLGIFYLAKYITANDKAISNLFNHIYTYIKPVKQNALVELIPDDNIDTEVLGENTAVEQVISNDHVSFYVPVTFHETVEFLKSLTLSSGLTVTGPATFGSMTGSTLNLSGNLTASNVVYEVKAGSGITVDSSKQTPTISNTGVLSVGGKTGSVTLEAGTGISIDGAKITNIASAPDYSLSGWTDGGTQLYATTITDSVGIGTIAPTSKLHVVGSANLAGNTTIGGATTDTITFTGRVANGTSLLPSNDLGSDIGSSSYRFNNLWVANLNSNAQSSFAGQTTFTYEPTSTAYTQSSVMINPTNPITNGYLFSTGIAGYQRTGIDEDGDLSIGYTGAVSIPESDYPLSIYNHGTTRIAYFDTDGNLNIGGSIISGSGSTVSGDLTLATGASIIPTADAVNALSIGNASSVDFVSFDTLNSRVGIGITGPTEALEVVGTILGTKFGFQDDPNTYIDTAGADKMVLATGGTERLTINSSGNVGIGTTAPSATFHLASTASTTNAITTTANSLSTGYGMSLTSTSTTFSTGRLMNLDWSPASATTATGDLFRLNIGANGTIGNLFNITDTDSSLFLVSETQIISALPHAFTAAGDVSMAYDLVFSNQNASNIFSWGPLSIESGESWESNNLTLRTYNAGNIVFDAPGGLLSARAHGWNLLDSTVNSLSIETTLMSFDTLNSRVGVGATTPVATLDVFGTAWLRGANTAQGLYVNSSGNVGVGTTSPTQALDLAGSNNNITFSSSIGPHQILTGGTTHLALMPGSGNVGIGTTSPTAALQVVGAGKFSSSLTLNDRITYTSNGPSILSSGGGTFSILNSSSLATLSLTNTGSAGIGGTAAGTNPSLFAGENGNVGVGTTAPGFKFQVQVDATTQGHVASDGLWSNTSDIRLKKNITNLEDPLDKILGLRGVRFDFISEETKASAPGGHIGFIAQEIEKIIPEVVETDKQGIKSVSYAGLTPVLVGAVQDQQKQIDELRVSGLAGLEARLKTLEEIVSDPLNSSNLPLTTLKDLLVNGGLTVEGTAEFKGKTLFQGLAEFFEKIIFHKEVEFADKVIFDKDTAGMAVIPWGANEVEVVFEKPYVRAPIVNMSTVVKEATDSAFLADRQKAYLSNVTEKGFKIVLPASTVVDATYNWVAVAVKDPKTTMGKSGLEEVLGLISELEASPSATPSPSLFLSPSPTIATPTATITPSATPTPTMTP